MIYFGGGYPGLYFPTWMVPPPPPPPPLEGSILELEIPMHIVTGGTTRPVTVLVRAHQAMSLTTTLTVPMARGMAERAEIPMWMTTRGLAPSSLVTPITVPLPVSTDWTSEPMRLLAESEQPMSVSRSLTVPMARGMAERAEIPMQMITEAIVERT
jgi:hypothetical protein